MMHQAKRENRLNIESAARKFAVAGAVGLAVIAAAERNAGAQTKGAEETIYQPLPVQVLAYRKQQVADAGAGSYAFNSRATRVMQSDAGIGAGLGLGGRISLGPQSSHEYFRGYGSYSGPGGMGASTTSYSGYSLSIGTMARIRFMERHLSPVLVLYGNAAYRNFEAEIAGVGGNAETLSVQKSGWGMNQCGAELRMNQSSASGFSRFGIGMLSDPRNAFMFATLNAGMGDEGRLKIGQAITPILSLVHGNVVTGIDIRPIEIIYQSEAGYNPRTKFSFAPGMKYSHDYVEKASTLAAYGSAAYSAGKIGETRVDISAQSGYVAALGNKIAPSSIFGIVSVGMLF